MILNDTNLLPPVPPPGSDLEIAAVWARCDAADPSHPYLVRHRLPPLTLRQVGKYLVVPLQDGAEALVGLCLIDADGVQDVWPKTAAQAGFVMERPGAAVTIIARGTLADAIAIHCAGTARVVHLPMAANVTRIRDQIVASRPGQAVLIAEPSANAVIAARPVGVRLLQTVVPPPRLGWAQLYRRQGAAGVRSWIDDPAIVFGGVALPSHLTPRRSGLWLGNVAEDDAIRISGPVLAIALAREDNHLGWSRVVYLRDRDGGDRMLSIPEQELLLSPRRVIGRLLDAGLEISDPGLAQAIVPYLAQTQVVRRLIMARRGGWHGRHYIGRTGTIGPAESALPVLPGQFAPAMPPSASRLEAWKRDIGTPAEGNSRLVLAIGVALGGIAIGLLDGQGSFGVHLRGMSSTGKSTALRVAASVQGAPRDEVHSWSATENGLEVLAARHHHRALLLDELAQIAPEAAVQAAYLLGNGMGRARATGAGKAAAMHTWQLTFLSSGEIALEHKIAERADAPVMREGQAVRLVDLPADAGRGHGVFECLHGHANGAALADHLNRVAEASRGDLALAFAAVLARDVDHSRALLRAHQARFIDQHLPSDADGISRRVFANLGVLAAACEVATHFGLLPWREGSGTDGLATCARDWRSARAEQSAAVMAHAWLAANAHRLTPWETGVNPGEGIGYRRQAPASVYLLPAGWRELCGDIGSARMKAELASAGIFRYAPARLPGSKLRKFYIIDDSGGETG